MPHPPDASRDSKPAEAAPGDEPSVFPCPKCGEPIAEGDDFCRHCGKRLNRFDSKFYRPGWILFLMLTVLGPLAIPLVMRSPHMTRPVKIAFSIAIVVFTAVILAAFAYITIVLIRHTIEFQREMDQW